VWCGVVRATREAVGGGGTRKAGSGSGIPTVAQKKRIEIHQKKWQAVEKGSWKAAENEMPHAASQP